MQTIDLGDVSITRVVDWVGPVATVDVVIPDAPAAQWKAHRDWLAPDFWDPATNAYEVSLQSWVVRSGGRTIIVDTSVGDRRDRPNMPDFHMMDSAYMGALAAAGVAPEQVDLVVNTHLHVDHVGWNTHDADGQWVPTFPNATYLFARPDVDYWAPDAPRKPINWAVNVNVWEDSIEPIIQAGQSHVWDGQYRIDEHLSIELAPGHTPGMGVITVDSGGARAVLAGDLLHSPIQVVDHQLNSCFCEDPEQARRSRARVLGWAADHHALVLPAHLPAHGGFEVSRAGSDFSITRWAPFDSVTA